MLLIFSAMIPNEGIKANIKKSALTYKNRDAFEITYKDKLNSTADNYADSIWINISLNIRNENPVYESLLTDYYDGEELGENAGLYYTVFENTPPNKDYSRYWHGTAMFIRFFHLFTDINGIKTIGFSFFIILVILSALILIRKKHTDIAIILILSLLSVQIWNIRLSIEYQPSFIIAFMLIPFYITAERYKDEYLTFLSVISGVAVAFFDFLTTETVAILLPLMLVFAIRKKENRLSDSKSSLLLLIKCAVCWGLSYIGAFFIKWTLSSLISGTNTFINAFSSVSERTGSIVGEFQSTQLSVLSSIFANLTMLFGGTKRVQAEIVIPAVLIIFLIFLSVWYLFKNEGKKENKEKNTKDSLIILGLGLIVIIRYIILCNHSYLHCFFTYRALISTVFSVYFVLWINISLPHKKRRHK